MRLPLTLLFVILLLAAPAAQAHACTCAAANTAPQAASCCGDGEGECCGCCDEPAEESALGERCACTITPPQTENVPELVFAAAPVSGLAEYPRPSAPLACTHPTSDVRGDPHPEVCLPLLL